ncbi:ARM repeat-containing protein [Ophiobolus disseminans]|uniref:ARM repeat-containing protein n=1 Tax=Ophiobolus disseminans TaxID=1469910 RepID=A0A6A6ZBN6_9PLEO|nr:ARM repeat-containing protein [Ophiobolus disseminans]
MSLNTTATERSSHSNPWATNIWNTTSTSTSALGFGGFGSTTRESSRPRENGSYDLTEEKTGSGSLVADSETEWRPSRPSWADKGASSIPHVRSSGVSPARKRSIAHSQSSQQYADLASSSFFPVARNAAVGSGSISKPPKPLLDPTSTNFTSSRQVDSLSNGFSSFGFGQSDASQQRPDTAVTSWPDSASIHSPNDDRRSVAASEYFASSSGAPSRNGSLPPSRHGADPAQFSQHADAFSRFAPAAPRQTSSFSYTNGRPYQERSGSIQSESFHTLGRLASEQEQDARVAHRQSVSINGLAPTFSQNGQDSHVPRDSYPDTQIALRTDDANYRNGTHTPDSYANGQVSDPSVQFRNFQFDSRSAPNGTGVRQSPFYTHAHTPPVYDRLNPYSSEQTLSHPNNFALVQNKLVGYQIQQERRNYTPNGQFHQQQFQHILPATQLRNPYAYPQYAIPNGMPMSALPPHMAMASMSPMISAPQPPRGPREQQTGEVTGIMSIKLETFRKDQKTSKRWELNEIYDNVVEFAGDQHGSRFIQQKLETANSEVKDRIFKELESNALQLMQDVFGNYVIQKFFEHGDQTQKKVLAGKMKGHVMTLANQMYACRVVQKALEFVLVDQQAAMVKELEKDPLKAVRDQNGNHVIQKVIERVPMEYMQTIVEAFRGHVGALSVNSYGCRVIQRLLEKVPEPQRRFILEELHAEGPKLITDSYGNYVVQHVIEHGLPEDRAKILALIKADYLNFSKHKFASNVVERCLVCGNDEQLRELVDAFVAKNDRGENNLLLLLRDGYGNYVIQKLLETLSRDDYLRFVDALWPELERCKKIVTGGKQIISVEKKMYRFSRVDSPTAARELIEAPPTPALSSSAQSPQSSSMPSTNTSTVDDPVHSTTPIAKQDVTASPDQFGIQEITS